MQQYQRDMERYRQQADAANRKAQNEERKRRQVEKERDAAEARRHLERVAMGAGIHADHVDFAVHSLERHLQNLPEDQRTEAALSAFDEKAYFEGMRGTQPYLFGVQQIPATTGTGPSNAQPPRPPRVSQSAAQGNVVDAMTMSREEFAEHKRKLGLGLTAPASEHF
jgi:hypothetical protein